MDEDEAHTQAQAQAAQPIEIQPKPKESKRRRTRRQRRRRQQKHSRRADKQRGGDNQLYDWLKTIKNTPPFTKEQPIDTATFNEFKEALTIRGETRLDTSFTEDITPLLYARFSYTNDDVPRSIYSVAKAVKEIMLVEGLFNGLISEFAVKITNVRPEIRDFLRTIEDILRYKIDGSSGATPVGTIAMNDILTDTSRYPLYIWALAACLPDVDNTPDIPMILPSNPTTEPAQTRLPSP